MFSLKPDTDNDWLIGVAETEFIGNFFFEEVTCDIVLIK